ncbi:MAG: VWA domain-containing protein, partial [Planctomycetota bacterium]
MRTVALGLLLLPASLLLRPSPTAHADDFDLPINTHVNAREDTDPSAAEEDEATFYDEQLPDESDSVIFVVDRSASMSLPVEPFVGLDGNVVQGATRLDFVKTELKRSISALPPDYTFNIIVYDECVERWKDTRQPATDGNKARAIAWLDQIVPWGWTNTGGATSLALSDQGNSVVLVLSDGAPNFLDCAQSYVADFETHRRVIRTANAQKAIVHTFGIGL